MTEDGKSLASIGQDWDSLDSKDQDLGGHESIGVMIVKTKTGGHDSKVTNSEKVMIVEAKSGKVVIV